MPPHHQSSESHECKEYPYVLEIAWPTRSLLRSRVPSFRAWAAIHLGMVDAADRGFAKPENFNLDRKPRLLQGGPSPSTTNWPGDVSSG